jgi:hypothetical protein
VGYSPSYAIGVLDVLVKSGEISPDYAAGVADVLLKDAQYASAWYNPFDTEAENLQQQWNSYMNRGAVKQDPTTGQVSVGVGKAKEMIDKAQPWYDGLGARAGANFSHWGRSLKYLLNGNSPEGWLGKAMSPEESARLREYDRNKVRQNFLRRGGAAVPAALQSAFQDEAARDARWARRDQSRYMAPGALDAEFGADEEAAAAKFRSTQGTAMMRGGAYKPKYDVASAQTPQRQSIHTSPLAGMYGSKDRAKLFSQPFRNGLGMY